jgi:hypothetical protein
MGWADALTHSPHPFANVIEARSGHGFHVRSQLKKVRSREVGRLAGVRSGASKGMDRLSGTFNAVRRHKGVGLRWALISGLAAGVLTIALSTTVTPAFACSCTVAPSAGSPKDTSVLVFLGRVESITPQGNGASSSDLLRVQFRTQIGESMSSGRTTVLTPSSDATCGYPFVVGSTYEVHALITGDYPVTDACSGTRISTRPLPVIGYPTDPLPNRVLPMLVLGVIVIATVLGGLVIVGTRIMRTRRQGAGARRHQ